MDTSGHDAFVKDRAEHFINQDVEEQGLTKRDLSCRESWRKLKFHQINKYKYT